MDSVVVVSSIVGNTTVTLPRSFPASFTSFRVWRPRNINELGYATEIQHMGGGLFAPLPDRGDLRCGAPARRGGGWCGLCQGGAARWQCHAVCAGAADGL